MARRQSARRKSGPKPQGAANASFDHCRAAPDPFDDAPLPRTPEELWDPDDFENDPQPEHGDFWMETDGDED